MEQEIRKLIDTYEQLLHDHKLPIDLTTKEQYRLEGYDAAILAFVSKLKDILYFSKTEPTEKEILAYTE